ncbi:hypothetical protein ABZ446_38930 [Streptomyces sp. NPDC005813]|uniref:hypothetical protein n=1 Tax=Streptomyces sp. NPDC005813 TaxID=3155592 RepID=UPI0033C2A819
MRRHTARTAATLCAAASLVAALATASAATSEPSPSASPTGRPPTRPVIVDCFWQPQVRPADFMLACGDGNSRLSSLRWTQWDANSATALGVNMVNDCKPYCAAGKFHAYEVIVRLENPQSWKKQPEMQHYTKMSLHYPENRPDGYTQVMTYALWN